MLYPTARRRISLWKHNRNVCIRLLLPFILAFGLLWFWADRNDPTNDRPFQREIWLQETDRERVFMAQDLVERHIKPGMNRKQVLEMLGDREAKNNDPDRNSITYDLGSYSDLGIGGSNGVKVVITFDDRQKVTVAYLDEY
jgi:hypothetical protein